MAKEVAAFIKLQIKGGAANPSPPVGFADFAASGKVILFWADFPRTKKQNSKIAAQNRQLMQVYRVNGVPSVILTDPSGKEFARTGYRPGGAQAYVEHLDKLLKKTK